MTRRTALLTLGAAGAGLAAARNAAAKSPRWTLQYFYDRDDEALVLNDFCFASKRFGIAVGHVAAKNGKIKPMAVASRDGGAQWDAQPLPDAGLSLFFLDDSLGWMVGEKALWRTEEGGRDWKKLKRPKAVTRVCFRDASRGWAIGPQKTVLETRDGGRTWSEVEEAAKPPANPDFTSYNWMEWRGENAAIIVGAGVPLRRGEGDQPAWLNPRAAERRRQWPGMTIALETSDGGATWRSQTVPAFGVTTRFRATTDGSGLVLVRFADSFEYPAELYVSTPKGGGSRRVYREKNRVVTDCAWWTPTKALIAAVEPPGRLHQLPIPGRLHMLSSANLTDWTEMAVDHRAFASRALLAAVDDANAWVATDTGQILRFAP